MSEAVSSSVHTAPIHATKAEIHELAQRKLTNMDQKPELLRGIYFRCCVADLLS